MCIHFREATIGGPLGGHSLRDQTCIITASKAFLSQKIKALAHKQMLKQRTERRMGILALRI